MFHHRVHKIPTVHILDQLNPDYNTVMYWFNVYLNISSHLLLGLPSGLFSSHLPNKFVYDGVMCLLLYYFRSFKRLKQVYLRD